MRTCSSNHVAASVNCKPPEVTSVRQQASQSRGGSLQQLVSELIGTDLAHFTEHLDPMSSDSCSIVRCAAANLVRAHRGDSWAFAGMLLVPAGTFQLVTCIR